MSVEIFSDTVFGGENLTVATGRYNLQYLIDHTRELKKSILSMKIPKNILVNLTIRQVTGDVKQVTLFSGKHKDLQDIGIDGVIQAMEVIPFIRNKGSDSGAVVVSYRTSNPTSQTLTDGDHIIENPKDILSINIRPMTLAIFYDGASFKKADRSYAVKGPIIMTADVLNYENVYVMSLAASDRKEKKVSINAEKIDVEVAKSVRDAYKEGVIGGGGLCGKGPAIGICIVIFVIVLAILIAVKFLRKKKVTDSESPSEEALPSNPPSKNENPS